MKNSFIIDRVRYDLIQNCDWLPNKYFNGLPSVVVQHLDFYIIEEEDGSATFIKNRHNGKPFMTKEEYAELKQQYG